MTTAKETTSVEAYLLNNPEYLLCRTERHIWDLIDDGWIESYHDAQATHEKKAQCPRCKMIRRRRARVVVRRGRVVSFERLTSAYDDRECKDYYLKGTSLPASEIDEWEIQQLITAQRGG